MKDYLLRAFLVWLTMVPVAIFNGAMRGVLFTPHVSELTAHIASTTTGTVAMTIVSFCLIPFIRPASRRQAYSVGAFWVALTVIFEFSFGHFSMGHSWGHLFADYNLFAGRVWSLFLVAIFWMPYLTAKLRKIF